MTQSDEVAGSPAGGLPGQLTARDSPPAQAYAWAGIVLVIGLLISGTLAWRQSQANQELVQERFDVAAQRLVGRTVDTVSGYEEGLQAARGVVMTGGEDGITRRAFRDYSETRDYAKDFPGALGFGFVRIVPRAQLDDFLARVRKDGAPDYKITQDAPHSGDLWPVEFVEPAGPNAAALGIDAASEPSRKQVGLSAMRDGVATISEPITIAQAQQAPLRSFLIELPVYRPGMPIDTPAQREAATFGWTYAVLVADDVIGGAEQGATGLSLGLYDEEAGSAEDLLYTDDTFAEDSSTGLQYDASEQVYTRDWHFVVRAQPSFVASQNLLSPWTVFGMGALASLLLAGITLLAVGAVGRRRQLAEQLAVQGLLEQTVAERTREMEIERDRAEDAARAKSEFLAHMSHEIRTPMNSVIGMSDLALREPMTPRGHNFVDKANRSAKNLMGILNDILDFSKIEAGRLQLEQAPFRLDDVLDDFATLVGLRAEDKGLKLQFDITPDVPNELVGDGLRLGQILLNLGNNAVKFTDSGGVTVGVRVDEASRDSVLLRFRVTDTGIGMSQEEQAGLFTAFTQGDASTSRRYGGTGLGLAISKSLVEGIGGRIWVESVPAGGSTFSFTARFGKGRGTGRRRTPTQAELAGRRLLVIDDSATSRLVLSEMANRFSMSADTAESMATAERLVREAYLQQRPYDLLLVDWRMPQEDGLAGLSRFADEFGDIPPVIMVSAFSADELRSAAQDQGVALDHILTKPVLPSRLLDAVGSALGVGDPSSAANDDRLGINKAAIPALRGRRILLVEDNEFNQELALEVLQGSARMIVVVAGNGREALETLTNDGPFDAVLMDCMMPVMDGYDAARAIRENPAWSELPVIAMTANAMEGDRERVLAAGMNDHVAKPIDVSVLLSTIARWIASDGDADAG